MDRTRAALHAALLSLLEEGPLEAVTVREIAARAECGYATFFRHYPDKSALLAEIAAAEVAALFQALLPVLSGAGGTEASRALCREIAGRRSLWRALLTGGAAGQVRRAFLVEAQRAAADAPPRGGMPGDLAAGVAVSAVLEVLDWWLRQAADVPADTVAGWVDRLVVGPALDAMTKNVVLGRP